MKAYDVARMTSSKSRHRPITLEGNSVVVVVVVICLFVTCYLTKLRCNLLLDLIIRHNYGFRQYKLRQVKLVCVSRGILYLLDFLRKIYRQNHH